MSRKASLESRFLEWAETAPLPTVQAILGIVSTRVKARAKAENPPAPRAPRKSKRTRTNADDTPEQLVTV